MFNNQAAMCIQHKEMLYNKHIYSKNLKAVLDPIPSKMMKVISWFMKAAIHHTSVADPAMGPRGPGAQGAWVPFLATKILIFIIVFTHSFVNIINAGNNSLAHCLL